MHLRQKKKSCPNEKMQPTLQVTILFVKLPRIWKSLEIITENSRTTFLYSCLFDNSTVCEG
jgi:hypothetical protein